MRHPNDKHLPGPYGLALAEDGPARSVVIAYPPTGRALAMVGEPVSVFVKKRRFRRWYYTPAHRETAALAVLLSLAPELLVALRDAVDIMRPASVAGEEQSPCVDQEAAIAFVSEASRIIATIDAGADLDALPVHQVRK